LAVILTIDARKTARSAAASRRAVVTVGDPLLPAGVSPEPPDRKVTLIADAMIFSP
jgi:hypothetical protein